MKRNMTAAAMVAVLILGFCGSALAGSGAGAINLTFPIGARYNALGEAGTALSQDVTAIWWNPGGLGFLEKEHDVHIMQSPLAAGLADDIALYWGGYAMEMGYNGTFGVALNYLSMGKQDGTDENADTTKEFRSYMFAFSAAYGVRVSRTLGLGIGVKYFRDSLAPDSVLQDGGGGGGDSFGVDLGMLWKVPAAKTNFAVSVANLGPNITHVDSDQSDPMPRKVTIGLAFFPVTTEFMGLTFVADYLVPLYKWKGNKYGYGLEFDQEEFGLGAEWNYFRTLYLRAGWKSAKYGDIEAMTFGFGVDFQKTIGEAITFDFAAVPQAEGLDRVMRFSLGYRF